MHMLEFGNAEENLRNNMPVGKMLKRYFSNEQDKITDISLLTKKKKK